MIVGSRREGKLGPEKLRQVMAHPVDIGEPMEPQPLETAVQLGLLANTMLTSPRLMVRCDC